MSEVEKPKSLGDFFKRSSKASDWGVMEKFITPEGSSIDFLTEINCPVEMSIADLLAKRDLEYGIDARDTFLKRLRVNMIPYKRKHNETIRDAWVAVSLQTLFKQEDIRDKLFGERR